MIGTHLTSRGIVKLSSIHCHVVVFGVQYINMYLFTISTEVSFTVMTVILCVAQSEAALLNADL